MYINNLLRFASTLYFQSAPVMGRWNNTTPAQSRRRCLLFYSDTQLMSNRQPGKLKTFNET
jgi:hypothetical protein